MRVILFGASGMVGQGVLRECLAAGDVTHVLSIGRSKSGLSDPKLEEWERTELFSWADAEARLTGYDACFFCLGVSSGGMKEADYRRLTYDLTLAVATALRRTSPGLTFVYVSGAGTDSTAKGRSMWARVKGETENALLALGFPRAFMFRPALIRPLDGIVSKTPAYRLTYAVLGPVLPLVEKLSKNLATNTRTLGRAMLRVAREGGPSLVLENAAINALGAA